jgi:predicted nucleic acid-binding protein
LRTVVDASVALKWYFEEPGCEAADAILEARIAGERDLLAPDLLVPEFANALWKKTRRGECSAEDAAELWELWEVDRPELLPSAELAPRALALANALDHSVYDCLYMAAAVEADAAFATADRELARAARTVLVEVELIV